MDGSRRLEAVLEKGRLEAVFVLWTVRRWWTLTAVWWRPTMETVLW